MTARTHWAAVYSKKAPEKVSWYRPHLDISLGFLSSVPLSPSARIVDVGGGASTFVDDLLAGGYRNVAVVDLAPAALDAAKTRLGARAEDVEWIVGDVTTESFPTASVDFWHDRAVFHFLTEPEARATYLRQVSRSVKPGGYVLVATFGPGGPDKCSGLPVVRYDAEGLHAAFGAEFRKIGDSTELHLTPWGSTQAFVYCFCRKSAL